MSDVSIAASSVHIDGTNAKTKKVQYGEIVTAGVCVYKKASDGKYWKADRREAATSDVAGIVVDQNVADGYGLICTGGDVDVGGELVIGDAYILGDEGGFSLPVDKASLDTISHLGYAITVNILRLSIENSIITLA